MPHIWVVIGDAHMHKTSTIRALTGVGKIQPKWDVEYLTHGTARTYVHPPGLQEINVSPKAFIQKVTKASVQCVIVALRYHQARADILKQPVI